MCFPLTGKNKAAPVYFLHKLSLCSSLASVDTEPRFWQQNPSGRRSVSRGGPAPRPPAGSSPLRGPQKASPESLTAPLCPSRPMAFSPRLRGFWSPPDNPRSLPGSERSMAAWDNHCRKTKGAGIKDISSQLTQDSPPGPLGCDDSGPSEVPNQARSPCPQACCHGVTGRQLRSTGEPCPLCPVTLGPSLPHQQATSWLPRGLGVSRSPVEGRGTPGRACVLTQHTASPRAVHSSRSYRSSEHH